MADADSIESDVGEPDASEPDDDDLGIDMAPSDQMGNAGRRDAEEFHHEVLSPDEIVRHMCDIIREVTNVVQVCEPLLSIKNAHLAFFYTL